MPYVTRRGGKVVAVSAALSPTAMEFLDDSHADVREFLTRAQREQEAQQLRAEMNAADIRAVRAIAEGDAARIEAHKADQAVRRVRLAALINPTQ
jgi:hypothetical protein